jgi:hypothetical protein
MKPVFLLSAIASGLLIGGAFAQVEPNLKPTTPIVQPTVTAPTSNASRPTPTPTPDPSTLNTPQAMRNAPAAPSAKDPFAKDPKK